MKTFVCIDCGETHEKTGRNQKRCEFCGPIARAATTKKWMRDPSKNNRFTGTGSGAHNTPGEAHPMWNGGESKFVQVLAPAYYQRVRYCERCSIDLKGVSPAMRAVHHKDHNRKNNDESNFELLCKRCHQIEHECWKNFPNHKRD